MFTVRNSFGLASIDRSLLATGLLTSKYRADRAPGQHRPLVIGEHRPGDGH